MAVEKGLDPLGWVRFDEAGIRVRQIETEKMDLLPDTADHRYRLAKISLGVAGRMSERDEDFLAAGVLLAQIVLHDRIAAGKAVLGSQALIDSLGRMPLLGRR